MNSSNMNNFFKKELTLLNNVRDFKFLNYCDVFLVNFHLPYIPFCLSEETFQNKIRNRLLKLLLTGNFVLYLQGGISQVEKEYQVLQEQLKEACENYEHSNVKGSEETKDLEEKLKRNVEENKVILSETSFQQHAASFTELCLCSLCWLSYCVVD